MCKGIKIIPIKLLHLYLLCNKKVLHLCMEFSKQHIIENAVPSKRKQITGVYFLIDKNDEIVYIGSAESVLARLDAHKKKIGAKMFIKHFIIELSGDDKNKRLQLERHYVELFQPKHNKQYNPKYKRIKVEGVAGKLFSYQYIEKE